MLVRSRQLEQQTKYVCYWPFSLLGFCWGTNHYSSRGRGVAGWGIFLGGSYGFQEKLREDQLSSTEYKKGLYKKLTANKLSLKGGGSGAWGGGGRGSFCRDSTKILRPSPPAINSDWSIIKTSVNQNCILPPGLVTLLITKRKEYNAWYGPLPTSDRVIGKPWWKSLKDL